MASNSFLSSMTRRHRSVSECSEDNNSLDGNSAVVDNRIPITRMPRMRTTSLVEESESPTVG